MSSDIKVKGCIFKHNVGQDIGGGIDFYLSNSL